MVELAGMGSTLTTATAILVFMDVTVMSTTMSVRRHLVEMEEHVLMALLSTTVSADQASQVCFLICLVSLHSFSSLSRKKKSTR